jgi:hypothetical protein
MLEKNLVIAATDLPDSDDRLKQDKSPAHYSKAHAKTGIYGHEKLYSDNNKADEEVRFFIDVDGSLQEKHIPKLRNETVYS